MANEKIINRENLKEFRSRFQNKLENGGITVQKSKIAKQIENVSENSGSMQISPFVFQGTGTNNNTTATPTAPIAKQLEKRGNTIVYNQQFQPESKNHYGLTYTARDNVTDYAGRSTVGYSKFKTIDLIPDHKYFLTRKLIQNDEKTYSCLARVWTGGTSGTYSMLGSDIVFTAPGNQPVFQADLANVSGKEISGTVVIFLIDLTQWYNGNNNIPQEIISTPNKFFNHYNGDFHYSTGELMTANGRYLETAGFNQFDAENETEGFTLTTDGILTESADRNVSDHIRCIPSTTYYWKSADTDGENVTIAFYDDQKTFLSYSTVSNATVDTPKKACYLRVCYPASDKSEACLNLSWDGERDGEYAPFEKHVYDTGTEVLRGARAVCDVKTYSGAIVRKIGVVDMGTLNWTTISGVSESFQAILPNGKSWRNVETPNMLTPRWTTITNTQGEDQGVCGIAGFNDLVRVFVTGIATAAEFKTAMSGVTLYYELAVPVVEQGSPFAENVAVDDYGTMGALDGNGGYVAVPQCFKIFYPADYVLLTDDLYNYVDGDVTEIVLRSDVNAAKGISGTVTLTVGDWSDTAAIKTFEDLGENDLIQFFPSTRADKLAASDADIFIEASGQDVTFSATSTPTDSITYRYFITKGAAQ